MKEKIILKRETYDALRNSDTVLSAILHDNYSIGYKKHRVSGVFYHYLIDGDDFDLHESLIKEIEELRSIRDDLSKRHSECCNINCDLVNRIEKFKDMSVLQFIKYKIKKK